MPFLPENATLSTVDEGESFNHSITYTDEFGESSVVTIIANDINSNVLISSNNITGFYEDIFDQTIKYRTLNDSFVEVQKWNDVNLDELYGIYHFIQDVRTTLTKSFTAFANGESKTYNIIVNNSLDYDKQKLAEYVLLQPIPEPEPELELPPQEEIIPGSTVIWNNNLNVIVSWRANSNDLLSWKNNLWVYPIPLEINLDQSY